MAYLGRLPEHAPRDLTTVLLAFVLGFLLPTQVHGQQRFWATATLDGWQYAKWGMSADDVVDASNGGASLYTGETRTNATGHVKALSHIYDPPFHLDISFYFAFTDHRLNGIRISLINKEEHDQFVAIVHGIYGRPDKTENLFFSTSTLWTQRGVTTNLIDIPTEKIGVMSMNPLSSLH